MKQKDNILRNSTNRLVRELRLLHECDKYLATQKVPIQKIRIRKEESHGAGVRRTFAVLGCEWLTKNFIDHAVLERRLLKQKYIIRTACRLVCSLIVFGVILLNGMIVHEVYTQFPHVYYGKGLAQVREDTILFDDIKQFSTQLLTHLKTPNGVDSLLGANSNLPPELYHQMKYFLGSLGTADNVEVNSIFKDNVRSGIYHVSYNFKWMKNEKQKVGNFLFKHVNNQFKLMMVE